MQHVFGYTVAHDVSARDWQMKKNGGQWIIGKTMDGFCPLGPALVMREDIPGTGVRCSSVVRAFAHGAMGRRIDPSWGGPIELFSFQPVLHDWCNKGRGMYYPVCGMMHIKEPLLLIRKNSLCGDSRFSLLLSVWSFTICPTPYNHK